MSGGTTAALWGMAAVTAASAISSNYQANKQAAAQERATKQAEKQAREAAEQSAQETRRRQSNQADISGILSQNQNSMLSGGSTLLTGAGGVDAKRLNLGGGSTLG